MKRILLALLIISSNAYATQYGQPQGTSEATATSEANSSSESSSTSSQTFNTSVASVHDHPASSAAGLYLGACSNGLSAQTRSGGVGLSNPDKYCQMLQQAEAHWKGYKMCTKGPERDEHHRLYHHWLTQASDYIENTKGVAELAETSKDMATIGLSWGVIVYLIILI